MASATWEMIIPVLSTAHITQAGNAKLFDMCTAQFRGEGPVQKFPSGWMIYIEENQDPKDWLSVGGLPDIVSWFQQKYGTAGAWIRLDNAGTELATLPTYNW